MSLEAWRELLSRTDAAAGPETPVPDEAVWEALAEAGAAEDGALHPTLARAMEVVGAPLAELRIERGGTEVSGWIDADAAILLVPRGEGLFEIAPAAAPFLPDLIARLVELRPRPAEARSPQQLAPGALATAIASPGTASDVAMLRSVRDLWLLELSRVPDKASPRGSKIVDTDEGLWELEREEGSVRVVPTSPTRVWRRLTATVAALAR